MYAIGEVSRMTGIPASTLRYYESISLLPVPQRADGSQARRYTDSDLKMIAFIDGLKKTGMRLEDIVLFAQDGCLLLREEQPDTLTAQILNKRVDLLTNHINQLQEQIAHLQAVQRIAAERRAIYADRLPSPYCTGPTNVNN
ncbi:MerR family transcriptional regulator [Paenibacillus rhizovicinus]|uniref:MerR family transcriptional regulator n=1 Tax=Paenibacillus rhizovicinus TaxID=2704463 RepID=A0A6C0P5F5_9BACL|nr:MerR family transcriptional regulator [Paenibacillus rhizovicinus]QHW33794.1 MerR family transcriptional regulator [Paenibacillus rhizovicinus]